MLLLTLCLFSCAMTSRYPAAKSDELHVVFDIDWTIVSEVKFAKNYKKEKSRMIEVQGKTYFISHGLESFVQELLSIPGMKVSFYSGGKKMRNTELLEKIKLKDGRSLKEVAYKILSYEDLIDVIGAEETLPFSEKHKKDLTKITKDLDQLIMFDDTADFVVEDSRMQKNYVHFIGKAFEYFESFSDTQGKSGEYIPKSFDQWLLNRSRLLVLNMAFREALVDYRNGKMTFAEAMKMQEELLDLKSQEWNDYSNRYYHRYYGRELPAKTDGEDGCFSGLSLLIGLKP